MKIPTTKEFEKALNKLNDKNFNEIYYKLINEMDQNKQKVDR